MLLVLSAGESRANVINNWPHEALQLAPSDGQGLHLLGLLIIVTQDIQVTNGRSVSPLNCRSLYVEFVTVNKLRDVYCMA